MTNKINEKIEAAAFRRLIQHFKENPDIQNIDLMELAGFCRNCISKWYMEEAIENGASKIIMGRGIINGDIEENLNKVNNSIKT